MIVEGDYEIKIIERKRITTTRNEWKKLRDRIKEDEDDNYGYVGAESTETEETTIFKQIVERLPLKDIIDAINHIQIDPREGRRGVGGDPA